MDFVVNCGKTASSGAIPGIDAATIVLCTLPLGLSGSWILALLQRDLGGNMSSIYIVNRHLSHYIWCIWDCPVCPAPIFLELAGPQVLENAGIGNSTTFVRFNGQQPQQHIFAVFESLLFEQCTSSFQGMKCWHVRMHNAYSRLVSKQFNN